MKLQVVANISAVISSGMSLVAHETVSSESFTSIGIEIHSNKTETNNTQVESLSKAVVDVPVEDRWDAIKNIRYKQLAREEALRELSIKELSELEDLTHLRRFEKYPRSADEILWQRRQQKLTSELISKLAEYVKFHEAPHNAQKFS